MSDDEDRLQLDLKGFPDGVVPRLRSMASAKSLTISAFVRTVLIDCAVPPAERPGPHAVESPPWA